MLSKVEQGPAVSFRAVIISLLFFATSCASSEIYPYDQTGFDSGDALKNPNPVTAPTRVAPDYYYRQPAYNTPQTQTPLQSQTQYQPQYQAPQQVPPPYSPQPTYAAPPQAYQQVPQQQQVMPYYPQQPVYYMPQQADTGSRFYSNPYAIPPAQQASRYDADQFYVPPTYRNNIEAPQPAPVTQDRTAVRY